MDFDFSDAVAVNPVMQFVRRKLVLWIGISEEAYL